MSSNQKRIRDLERMMKKFGNTPDLLAKLEAAKQSKGEVQVKEKMRKNSTKYHMVKFLERKKMTRSIRSVESKIKKEEDPSELAALNKKRDKLLEDLAYIMYYPMEHKYIALFPAKSTENDADSDGEVDVEKSKVISQKARALAVQRWQEDQSFGGDKVAYAMEVEYKGGAAAAESAPGKAIAANKEQQKAQQIEKAGMKSLEKKKAAGKGDKKEASSSNGTSAAALAKKSTSSGSDSDSSDSSDSDSDSNSDSDSDSSSGSESKTKSAKTTSTAVTAAKSAKPTKETKVVPKVESEESDNDNDDFFVEEANLSESELQKAAAAPKVYQDGNSFRYKEEKKNVHEIRFAATKRKYERHKRVFNNQNKRGDSDRSKKSRN